MLRLIEGSVRRDRRLIIEKVNFEVERGEISLLLGPNGSGKTTVFLSLAGVIGISSGKVFLEGADITDLGVHERFRRGIVLAPDRMRIAPNLSVEENLLIGARKDISEAYETFPSLRKLRGQKAKTLSGGERQMLVFGRALLSKPTYLLLDEPFQGLQEKAGDRVIESIKGLKEEGVGIAVISHERIEEFAEFSERFYVMIAGRIVYAGGIRSPDKMLGKLAEFMPI
jgi:branched-chain amino acid transport system ATP-binding protein